MTNWNSKVPWPKDNYILRIIDGTKFAPNNNGNPMLTVVMELVSPDKATIGGTDYNLAGTKITQYIVTQVKGDDGVIDAKKTADSVGRLNDFYAKCGLEVPNPENPDITLLKGKIVWALVYGDMVAQTKPPTPEEIAAGKRTGQVLKNPVTGKDLISYWPKIDEVFGPAEEIAAGSY